MTITIGRIVRYRLSGQAAEQINRRRQHAATHMDEHRANSNGVQVHVGNSVNEGDEFPLIVTRVWTSNMINGQVMLDGNDLWWATSVKEGSDNGTWSWPMEVAG